MSEMNSKGILLSGAEQARRTGRSMPIWFQCGRFAVG
jgi:hypothetical protein